jgi:DNA-binding LacI/PurR family transcriptional regulator/signal transduction histidine kinase/DNA-binding NarL/FixJ family response regulator
MVLLGSQVEDRQPSRMTTPFEVPPPSGARSQPGRRTIAVLLDYTTQFVGSYEARLRSAFDAKCRQIDLNLLLVYGGAVDRPYGGSVTQNAIFGLMHPDRIDGLILLSTTLASFCGPDRMCHFAEQYRSFPLCSIGLELPGVPSIVVDNRGGVEAVLEHMLREHDRRRLAFIGGPPENPEAQIRAEAYRSVLERRGIAVDPALMADGYFTSRGGYAAMDAILARGVEFDAVIAANDAMALAAIRALRQRGYRVPRDLAVTGFDDVQDASLGNPPLTTVAQPFEVMAERAIALVLEQLAGRSVPSCIELPTDLIVRRSCGCGPGARRKRGDSSVDCLVRAGDYLREHAGSMLSELAGFLRVGSRDGRRDALRLLGALEAEVDGQTECFLQVVEDTLEEIEGDQQHCRALQNAIACLRERLRGLASPELEDLWHDAHDVIGLTSMRGQLQHRSELDISYVRLLDTGEQVSRALDVPSLKQALFKTLPALGVPTAFVSRDPDGASAELEPLVCLLDGHPVEPPFVKFAAHHLFPPGIYPPERRHTALVLPMVVEDRCLGVATFEYSAGMLGYQMLRDQIAGALSSIGLHQAVIEKTMLHERTVQEREATSRRMESLSVLAGGVAHDLNNALGPLVALPDVMRSELAQLDPAQVAVADLRTDLESIKSGALRAAQTIKDLLTLGRQGRTAKQRMDLNRVVADCLTGDSLRFIREANRRVGVVVDLAPEPIFVHASEPHLVRAITNLVRNAVEAIPAEGDVGIRTFGTLVAEPTVGYETVDAGDYAVVTVSDNGTGIPAQVLGRVFEPFFSKKRLREHSGSGLGLAIVHGVVKEHEGFVDVTSTLGAGTTFTLYFPRAEEDVAVREQTSTKPGGQARILLVDDEPVQLRAGSRVLGHLGYQVDALRSGRQARDLFRNAVAAGRSPYDLVILDMILDEELDGLELFEEIRRLFPEQRAILASGHAPTERVELALQKGLAWLAKPYTIEALAQAVQAALADLPSATVVKVPSRPPSQSPSEPERGSGTCA